MVGRYRTKVLAPSMDGPPEFNRALRVQLNTAERLVAFIPSIWFFGVFVDPTWATALGVLYLIGRSLYAIGYIREPKRRFAGSLVSTAAELALLVGALIGLLRNWSMLS